MNWVFRNFKDMQHKKILKVSPADNVAVALVDIEKGTLIDIDNQQIELKESVKAKHKIALVDFNTGDEIFMYGVLVGKATTFITKSGVITTTNTRHESSKVFKKEKTFNWTAPNVDKWKSRNFLGYKRADGQVGTANVWLFFPLVFCENRNIEILKNVFETELLSKKEDKYRLMLRSLVSGKDNLVTSDLSTAESTEVFENVEVKFITHQGGCGSIRQDAESLARLLAGYVNNPNVVGATVLSLGCQNLQIDMFKNALATINPDFKKPLLIYEQQKMGTVDNLLTTVIKDSFAEIKKANNIKREPAPLTKLRIGLECGGSDGFSGISANPTLGYVSDIFSALNGSVILSEFPELCGVEQEIVNRCTSDENANKFLALMAAFEKSVVDAGSGFDMNPSPGNIKDGLITDAMKSAGAAKKGGTSPVVDVLNYGEYVSKQGLTLLCTPGNDVESTTAMVGSGANLVLFTTGLGTPTGNPVAPIIKVSSNTALALKMPDIIDFNTGEIISGEKTLEQMGEELIEKIISVASGETKTASHLANHNDFIHWRQGVSL